LGQHKQAVADFDRALEAKLGPHLDHACRLYRALSLARIGDHKRAATAAEMLAAAPAVNLYNVACIYALAMPAARQDNKLPADERERVAEQYAAQALASLAKANTAGHFKDPANLEQLRKDTDLDSLRSRDDFKKLLNEVDKQAKKKAL
jgi:hypothetical protein